MTAIFDLHLNPMSESIHDTSLVLLNSENVGIAVEISFLSCMQAVIYVYVFPLPKNGCHLSPLSRPRRRRVFTLALAVWHYLKNEDICWKFGDISIDSHDSHPVWQPPFCVRCTETPEVTKWLCFLSFCTDRWKPYTNSDPFRWYRECSLCTPDLNVTKIGPLFE